MATKTQEILNNRVAQFEAVLAIALGFLLSLNGYHDCGIEFSALHWF